MTRHRSKATAIVVSLAGPLLLSGCLGDTPTEPDDGPDDQSSFLVFISDRSASESLHRVNLDGTGERQITGLPGDDGEPDCSTDGSQVAFTSVGRDGPRREVYLLSGSSGVLQRLTVRQGTGEEDYSPAWSPDGERLAFITSGRGQFGGAEDRVATMSPDGSVVEGVGDDVRGTDVDWAPGGQGLAVASESSDGNGDLDLFRVDADGEVTTLSDDPTMSETHPAWSGSGDRVFFTMMNADGTGGDIYSVRPDGTGLSQLTTHDAVDAFPTSSPDGSRVAFASDRSGNFEIYVMDADGGNVQRITDDPARDDQPTWCDL